MLELFPEGFEESETPDYLELAAYTDAEGEQRLRAACDGIVSLPVEPDWADRWRVFHRPVLVGPLWVGPPWDEAPPGPVAVVIDPGRAFGTGAHATTRLCLQLLTANPAGSLLDVGCGSGVLAIAGAKLGCDPVVALDDDPAAVAAARANAARNGVSIEVREADAFAGPLPAADSVVANLTLALVEGLAQRLSSPRLIASGYLESDEPDLPGFRPRERLTVDGWAADVFERFT